MIANNRTNSLSGKNRQSLLSDLPRARTSRRHDRPQLRFSPYAWAKLLFLRDRGPTEIGGFGITAANDPLYVLDFQTIPQAATSATIALDDSAVADYLDA